MKRYQYLLGAGALCALMLLPMGCKKNEDSTPTQQQAAPQVPPQPAPPIGMPQGGPAGANGQQPSGAPTAPSSTTPSAPPAPPAPPAPSGN